MKPYFALIFRASEHARSILISAKNCKLKYLSFARKWINFSLAFGNESFFFFFQQFHRLIAVLRKRDIGGDTSVIPELFPRPTWNGWLRFDRLAASRMPRASSARVNRTIARAFGFLLKRWIMSSNTLSLAALGTLSAAAMQTFRSVASRVNTSIPYSP